MKREGASFFCKLEKKIGRYNGGSQKIQCLGNKIAGAAIAEFGVEIICGKVA